MHKRYWLGWFRIVFGLLGLSAIVVQLVHQLPKGTFTIANFFSFFTIESNLMAVALLLFLGFQVWRSAPVSAAPYVRGAITLYMLITGVIYSLLLSGLAKDLQTTIPWVNTVVHYVMPVVILADWLIDPPRQKLLFKKALAWLLLPLGYVIYSLLRGHFTGWYPYPFLNAADHGYMQVAVVGGVISAGLVGLIAALVFGSRRLRHF